MGKAIITQDIKEKVNKIISDFNKTTFKDKEGYGYHAKYKGNFMYLNRMEGENDNPMARLKFTGDFSKWDFAIYKYSTMQYDPDEYFFWGEEEVDGTIEGALKAAQKAYPPNWNPYEIE
jgi:hypothetical protein